MSVYDGGSITPKVDGSGIGYSNSGINVVSISYSTTTANTYISNKKDGSDLRIVSRPTILNIKYDEWTSGNVMGDTENYIISGKTHTYHPQVTLSFLTQKTNIPPKKLLDFSYNKDALLLDNSGSYTFTVLKSGTHQITGTNFIDGAQYTATINENPVVDVISGIRGYKISEVNPENVLLVYNTRLGDSVNLKDYYTGLRTGLQGLNILGIDCFSGEYCEITNTGEYVREIREPIFNYIRSTDKPIKYCILMYGIPTWITGSDTKPWSDFFLGSVGSGYGYTGSVQYDLSNIFYHDSGYCRHPNYQYGKDDYWYTYNGANLGGINSGTYYLYSARAYTHEGISSFQREPYLSAKCYSQTFLCSHLFANNATDVSGYIDKITRDGVVEGVYLKGSGNNTGAIFVDASSPNYSPSQHSGAFLFYDAHYSGLNDNITYEYFAAWTGRLQGVTGTAADPLKYDAYTTGHDPTMFFSWGIHTAHANGANDTDDWASIQYTSNIYLDGYCWFWGYHIESFGAYNKYSNGVISYWFNAPFKQFANNAYHGTNYSNIPVATVSTLIEPGGAIVEASTSVQMWNSGFCVADAVYGSSNRAKGFVMIGDPFIKK